MVVQTPKETTRKKGDGGRVDTASSKNRTMTKGESRRQNMKGTSGNDCSFPSLVPKPSNMNRPSSREEPRKIEKSLSK